MFTVLLRNQTTKNNLNAELYNEPLNKLYNNSQIFFIQSDALRESTIFVDFQKGSQTVLDSGPVSNFVRRISRHRATDALRVKLVLFSSCFITV